jgi:hypothetical protein
MYVIIRLRDFILMKDNNDKKCFTKEEVITYMGDLDIDVNISQIFKKFDDYIFSDGYLFINVNYNIFDHKFTDYFSYHTSKTQEDLLSLLVPYNRDNIIDDLID